MSRSSIRVETEIQLLNEILAEHEAESEQKQHEAEAGPLECPSPQALWALFEQAAEETALTLGMHGHVNQCLVCGQLIENLRAFAATADGSSVVSAEGEAAWAAAGKHLERKIRSQLMAKRKSELFWKLSWLPPMGMAYAVGGCAAILLAAATWVVYYSAGKQEAHLVRFPQEEAAIWTKAGAQTADSTKPDSRESTGAKPASEPDREHLPEPTAGSVADESAVVPRPTVATSSGAADDETIAPGAAGAVKLAPSSSAVNTAADGPAVLLTAGTNARVQVLLVRQHAGGEVIEGNLAPLSLSGGSAVIFSAYLGEGSGPVRLRIHMLESDGKRLEVQSGEVSNVAVEWPAEVRKPVPGQTVVVKILNGAMVKSAGEKK